MKNTFLLVISFLAINFLQAQSTVFQWVKINHGPQIQIGNQFGHANAKFIDMDDSGNIYTVGEFYGTVDFNPSIPLYYGLTTYSNNSFYIQKLNANGGLVWVQKVDLQFGNIGSIQIDNSNNLIIVGNFKDSVDIDPGSGIHMLYSNGDYDVFILKLSANGNFIWAKSFGGPEEDLVRDLVIDPQGNVYTHGSYSDTVDFDPGSGTCIYGVGYGWYNNPLKNAFIQKLDKNGNFVWAKVFLNSEKGGYSGGVSIDLDSDGNVYCLGNFDGTGIDFDPGPGVFSGPSNNAMAYFVKLDSSGNFVWARFPGHITPYGYLLSDIFLTIDRFNNVYTSGGHFGFVDFDPGPDTLLLSDPIFIQKYDQNGNFLWAKSYGHKHLGSINKAFSLATDTFGNIYSTGLFADSTDLDPGPDTLMFYTYIGAMNCTASGAYIQKLNSNGDLVYAGILQGNHGASRAFDIIVDNTNNLFLAGDFADTVDFDPGPGIQNKIQAYGSSFLLKLGQCKTITTDYQVACDSLTWIDGITYYGSTNSAYYTLPYSTGCDSIVCLSLNVPQIDTSVSIGNYGGSLTANQSGASYQWLDCNNGFSILAGDTLQTFTPALNGYYSVAIDVSGCVDTSVCVSVNNVSIEEISGNTVKLYPNPNEGTFFLELKAQGNRRCQIQIFNTLGKEVLRQDIDFANYTKLKFDLGGFGAGVYQLRVVSGDGVWSRKVVVRF